MWGEVLLKTSSKYDPSRSRGGRKHVRFYSERLATPTRDSKAATAAAMSHNTRPRWIGLAGFVSAI